MKALIYEYQCAKCNTLFQSPALPFETALNGVFNFVKNPHKFYEIGDLRTKRTALNLVFAKKLEYDREKG